MKFGNRYRFRTNNCLARQSMHAGLLLARSAITSSSASEGKNALLKADKHQNG